MDELTTNNTDYFMSLTKVALNLDKNIFLLRAFEMKGHMNKKYLRSSAIMIGNELVTSTFTDTTHFFEELNLFDLGSDQNKYFTVVEKNKVKNLKLKINDNDIYLSKSEAKAIYKLFNLSMVGYSLSRVLEFEFKFTPDNIADVLEHADYLTLPDSKG